MPEQSNLDTEKTKKPSKRRGILGWLWSKVPYFIVIFLFAMIFAVVFFWRIVIVINSGEAGVLYRMLQNGTETNYIFPEGLHLIVPWDYMYIYDVRVQIIRHDFTVLTNQGLPITLRLAIRYRPEYDMVALLHKNVGPEYVDRIIVPQIESVLRRNIGQLVPQDVYTNKEGILNNIMRLAMEETSRKYVIVDEIIIREVQLPEQIRVAINEKLVQEQVLEKYSYILKIEEEEAKRKLIEAGGIRNYQETVAETLSEALIRWQGVEATKILANSENSKIVIIGAGEQGLPVILGNQWDKIIPQEKPEPAEPAEEKPVEGTAVVLP
jgi:regulator of protease activity HflC (stomatin/prohibitin superfamily)